jgi:GDP/UDP-N,N'-diacetylbacillosamine 2-epimerase (hydrolysing)
MKKILFISSSRADYGLLRNVILETKKNKKIKVFVLVTGSHLSKQFGNTIKEIEKDGLKKNIIKKKILKKSFFEKDVSNYISQTITSTSSTLDKIKPEKIVILGDRYELLGCAIASMSHRIPIAHIHGGEITSGAIDDSIRHSISKLSHLHFPIHDEYKKRLIQLGENPETIFNYGGLGAHSIKNIKFKSKLDLENELKIKLDKMIFLITFHPTTLEKNKSKYQVSNLLSALDKFKDVIKIFTSSNFDHENKIIKRKILNFTYKNKNAFFYSSLGHSSYVSLMKISSLVIGNSSSGVLETPSLGIPTVNIGNRQKGRIISKNIVNSKYEKNHIIKNIKKALILDKKKLSKIGSPFYKINTPKNIAKKIISFRCILKKDFKDLI